MVTGGSIVQTLISNWVNILVTSLATGTTLYYSRRYRTNARKERLSQAKESVIEVVEEHVIDDKKFSVSKFDNVISAAGRKHEVSLSNNVSKVSLLEDLELKIEKSNHLNSDQKEDYTNQIQEYIEEIINKQKAAKVTGDRSELIRKLSESIERGEKEEANEYLDSLQEEIEELEENKVQKGELNQELGIYQVAIAGTIIFITYFYILTQIDELFGNINLLVSPFVLVVGLIVILSYLYTYSKW